MGLYRLSGQPGVSQAFLALGTSVAATEMFLKWLYLGLWQNVRPEQVSLAYLVENLLALVKLCCR